MIKNQNNQELSLSSFEDFSKQKKVHFIGFGGAGSNLVEFLHSKKLHAKFTCVTNPERPKLHSDINFIKYIYPKNENLNFDIEISFQMDAIFNENENYILFSGLGGNTGAFLTVKIAEMLNEKNISFVSISSLPFKFEHSLDNLFDPHTLANDAKEKLKSFTNCYFFSKDEMKIYNPEINMFNFFNISNEFINSHIKTYLEI